MTTVVDPLGTPSVTYNRSGTAIVEVSPALSSSNGNAAAPIPRVSQTTIALVPTYAGHNAVRLPDDAEVGDVVEVYSTGTEGGARVCPNVGERISSLPVSTGTNTDCYLSVTPLSGYVIRKVSSSLWLPIGALA